MDQELTILSISDFTEHLSSKSPVPGGGGAAALCGALAAALCEMAGNLTVGKKKYAAFEEDQKRMIAKAAALRARFLYLIDADAAAFAPLSKAYSMPKETPGYIDLMARVTLDACRAPFQMLECCAESADLLEEMLQKCSRLMISDVGCGAAAAQAALEAAYLNVCINTRMLSENSEAQLLAEQSKAILDDCLPRFRAVIDTVTGELRRG